MALNRSTVDLQSIGTRLLAERNRLGLSQQEMADLGGVSRPSYRLYEDGRREPALGYILRIAEHGADIVYLLFGDKKRKRNSNAICLSEKSLGALFDNAWEIIESEYGGKLSKRDRRKFFVQLCRLAATSDTDNIDTAAVSFDLECYRT